MNDFIQRLYTYRELLYTSIRKDIRGRYKRSVLGILWSFLNPLLMVAVYAFVFPFILKITEDNYVVFLLLGILPWNFFSLSLNQGTGVIINNGNIIKKIFFPREILPISITTVNLIDFLISTIIIFVFVFLSGIHITWTIVFLPVIVLIQYILTLGFTLLISALTVYFRDLTYITNFILLIAFYLTPIVYSVKNFPDTYKVLMTLNPMANIINGYRDVLYYSKSPDFIVLAYTLAFTIILFIVSYVWFRKLEKGFAEEI